MNKIRIIIIAVIWVLGGASGAIKQSLRYEDLTISSLTTFGLSGSLIGPVTWIVYLMDSDIVLIKKDGRS